MIIWWYDDDPLAQGWEYDDRVFDHMSKWWLYDDMMIIWGYDDDPVAQGWG